MPTGCTLQMHQTGYMYMFKSKEGRAGYLPKAEMEKLKGKPLVIKKGNNSYTGDRKALRESQCLVYFGLEVFFFRFSFKKKCSGFYLWLSKDLHTGDGCLGHDSFPDPWWARLWATRAAPPPKYRFELVGLPAVLSALLQRFRSTRWFVGGCTYAILIQKCLFITPV